MPPGKPGGGGWVVCRRRRLPPPLPSLPPPPRGGDRTSPRSGPALVHRWGGPRGWDPRATPGPPGGGEVGPRRRDEEAAAGGGGTDSGSRSGPGGLRGGASPGAEPRGPGGEDEGTAASEQLALGTGSAGAGVRGAGCGGGGWGEGRRSPVRRIRMETTVTATGGTIEHFWLGYLPSLPNPPSPAQHRALVRGGGGD